MWPVLLNPVSKAGSPATAEVCTHLLGILAAFYKDLAAQTLPQWSFITPNMANDGHDTTITFAASWGRTFLTPVLNNTYFMNNTFIVLTFNKSDTYTMHNTVYTILLGGAIAGHENIVDDTFYNHFSILTSVELNWDLPSLGRWDCGANVLQVVSNATGYKNAVVDTTNLYFNTSYPGPLSDSEYLPVWPVPDTNSRCAAGSVLDSVVSTWGKSSGTYNYTNVYPYDNVSGNNNGGTPVIAGSNGESGPGSGTGSSPSQSSPNNGTSPNGSLSTGAKIGIGVSVPLVVIVLTLLIFCFVLRKRRKGQTPSKQRHPDQAGDFKGQAPSKRHKLD